MNSVALAVEVKISVPRIKNPVVASSKVSVKRLGAGMLTIGGISMVLGRPT